MREMVTDVMDPLRGEVREIAAQQREQRLPGVHVAIQVVRPGIEGVDRRVRRVVEAVRQVVDLVYRDARLGQAAGDCAPREGTGMLASVDPLLGDGGDNRTVDHEGSGRVVTLRDAILALVEPRPTRPLERYRPLEPADPEDLHPQAFRSQSGGGCGKKRTRWVRVPPAKDAALRRRDRRWVRVSAWQVSGCSDGLGGPFRVQGGPSLAFLAGRRGVQALVRRLPR